MSSFSKSLERIKKARTRKVNKEDWYIYQETEKLVLSRFKRKSSNIQYINKVKQYGCKEKEKQKFKLLIYFQLQSYHITIKEKWVENCSKPWMPSHQLFVEDSTIFLIVQKTSTPAQKHLA